MGGGGAIKYNDKEYFIYPPEKLKEIEFDAILIAAGEQYHSQILRELEKLNIPKEKIKISEAVNVIKLARLNFIKTLSVMQAEKNIYANAAELGVYKGETAKYINAYFKDSNFYLLDTFEGFDTRDIQKEIELDTKSKVAQTSDFSDTSLEAVKRILPYPQKCHFIKGYFPKSTEKMPNDLQFGFVNIDVDLYQPILEGLEYFYPRMVKGGTILVHDYFHPYYTGVKKAVDEFCLKTEIEAMPIGDGISMAIKKE